MDSPFIIPLGVFVMVALVVAIVNMVKLRDHEMDVRQALHQAELEHRQKMADLEMQLSKLK